MINTILGKVKSFYGDLWELLKLGMFAACMIIVVIMSILYESMIVLFALALWIAMLAVIPIGVVYTLWGLVLVVAEFIA